jgi:hypothetical protein
LHLAFKSNLIRPLKDDPIRELISLKHPSLFKPINGHALDGFAMKLIHVRDGQKRTLNPTIAMSGSPTSGHHQPKV